MVEDKELGRLQQILSLVKKEDFHLNGVSQRLFNLSAEEDYTLNWLESVLNDETGIDRLESFVGKLCRMQDTIMDKLIPQALLVSGEMLGSAIDNLNRAERLRWVESSEDWLSLRRLRNRLVHEYIEDLKHMLSALMQAKQRVPMLSKTYYLIAKLGQEHSK